MSSFTRRPIAIVTVHGTKDAEFGTPDSTKWWEPHSDFCRRLVDRIALTGHVPDVLACRWPPAENSSVARETGTRIVQKQVEQLLSTHERIHIIAHSHGGNVAEEALIRIGFPKTRFFYSGKIASITTVGTPFLRTHVGAWEYLLSWLVNAASTIGLVSSGLLALFCLACGIVTGTTAGIGAAAPWILATLAFVVNGATSIPAIGWASRGWLRVRLLRSGFSGGSGRRIVAPVHSIWHPNDEAIAFLMGVEALPLNPLPRGAVWLASHNWALTTAGALMVPISLASTGMLVFHITNQFPEPEPAAYLLLIGLGVFFSIFIYVVCLWPAFLIPYSFVRLLGALAEASLRKNANLAAAALVRGMSFGADGELKVMDVSPRSHIYEGKEVVLEGALAKQLADNAAASTKRLFERHRWSLFSIDRTDLAIDELHNDTLTWESLIHTTYFDHPELSDRVADYMLEQDKDWLDEKSKIAAANAEIMFSAGRWLISLRSHVITGYIFSESRFQKIFESAVAENGTRSGDNLKTIMDRILRAHNVPRPLAQAVIGTIRESEITPSS